MRFRGLKPSEISVRIDRITAKGAVLLLYKDARVDMDILDETVGPENWQRRHYDRKGNMFCSIGINVNHDNELPSEWVWKDDCGVESYTAKEKGEASDSFKRSGVNWGIGRELYSAPFIFVACKTTKNDKGKYDLADKYCLDGAYVSHIEYEETEGGRFIKTLAVVDKKGNIIYTNTGKSRAPIDPTEPTGEPEDINAPINKTQLSALVMRLAEMGYDASQMCTFYEINDLSEMTVSQWDNCNRQLANIEDKRKKGKENGQVKAHETNRYTGLCKKYRMGA